MTSTAELIAEIEQLGEEFARFVEGLSEEQFRRRPAPEEWTAAEITGHVSEAPLTFSRHAKKLADEGGGASGREPSDPGRLAAVERLAHPTLELIGRETWNRWEQGHPLVVESVWRFLPLGSMWGLIAGLVLFWMRACRGLRQRRYATVIRPARRATRRRN